MIVCPSCQSPKNGAFYSGYDFPYVCESCRDRKEASKGAKRPVGDSKKKR